MAYRLQKIQAQIKNEISLIFLHDLNDPAFGFLTITNVKVSPDLKIAKIYFSLLEKEKREETLERIEELKGLIRSKLASRIRMRYTPELFFYIDDTLDYVEKIEGLIQKIHENDKPADDEPDRD